MTAPPTSALTESAGMLLPTALQALLGVGVPAALGIAFSLWIARNAIAQAVTHAATTELSRLKSNLDKELEDHKSKLQRETERFRAELTLAAEMRRLVAAHKVSCTMDVMRLSRDLDVQLREVAIADLVSRNRTLNSIAGLIDVVRANQHFIGRSARDRLLESCEKLHASVKQAEPEGLCHVAASFINEVTLICSESLCLESESPAA